MIPQDLLFPGIEPYSNSRWPSHHLWHKIRSFCSWGAAGVKCDCHTMIGLRDSSEFWSLGLG